MPTYRTAWSELRCQERIGSGSSVCGRSTVGLRVLGKGCARTCRELIGNRANWGRLLLRFDMVAYLVIQHYGLSALWHR
jgi:hypothetical protein